MPHLEPVGGTREKFVLVFRCHRGTKKDVGKKIKKFGNVTVFARSLEDLDY